VTGEVVMNKNNPGLWGIKNLSGGVWKMTTPAGDARDVPHGGAIPVGVGVKAGFDEIEGVITE
jgi:hypothetical protein